MKILTKLFTLWLLYTKGWMDGLWEIRTKKKWEKERKNGSQFKNILGRARSRDQDKKKEEKYNKLTK